MARGNGIKEIELQIKKKEDKLFALKEQMDVITEELKALAEKKKELQKQELMDSFEKSGRTFEEVLEYLNSAPNRTGAARQNGKRKYQRRTKMSD